MTFSACSINISAKKVTCTNYCATIHDFRPVINEQAVKNDTLLDCFTLQVL